MLQVVGPKLLSQTELDFTCERSLSDMCLDTWRWRAKSEWV